MGAFIVFEGPDGSGKSTQVDMLRTYLLELGVRTITTREPGGTAIGDALRDILLSPRLQHMQPLTRVFVLNAARAELIVQVIKPALARGTTVICDRYAYSTLAYQAAGEGVDAHTVRILSDVATGGLEPDVVILLDLPPQSGLRRKHPNSLNWLDRQPLAFHDRVRVAYREMAERAPERWVMLDASRPAVELAEVVRAHVLSRMNGDVLSARATDYARSGEESPA